MAASADATSRSSGGFSICSSRSWAWRRLRSAWASARFEILRLQAGDDVAGLDHVALHYQHLDHLAAHLEAQLL